MTKATDTAMPALLLGEAGGDPIEGEDGRTTEWRSKAQLRP